MKRIFTILFYLSLLMPANTQAQKISVSKVEPPNWWTGMTLNKIQLMVYGENLSGIKASFNTDAIKVTQVHQTGNNSYSFIDVEIDNSAKPGDYILKLSNGNKKTEIKFPLLARKNSDEFFKGFDASDVIYLIMPDRFANGDYSNDKLKGYDDPFDKVKNQNRFGGDLKGIMDKLEYLKNLGISAIWLTPIVENNTFRSYHGYAATDFYKVDPRIGTNEQYQQLVQKAHSLGIKIIIDHVSNHFSNDHPWIKNLPAPDWINGSIAKHLNADHNKMEFTDPYADSTVIRHIEQGWFTDEMPDLNQENPYVAKYIIQNTIWWMEYSGADGIREDTYPYNNQKFMADWAKTVLDEFPTTNIVGEVWTGETAYLAGYQKDTFLPREFNSNLPAITDFGLRDAFANFLQNRGGLFNIFEVLSKDYLYKNPENLVTFADNHDMARVMYFANGNVDKAKLVYSILFTTRGIPALFYGSEIGLVGTQEHGELRMPFPGGFKGDTRNAFTREGRNDYENDMFDFIQTLLSIRKEHPALYRGKLIHFPPANNVYVYFRILPEEKIMIVANGNPDKQNIDLTSMQKLIPQGAKLKDLRTGQISTLGNSMTITTDGLSAGIYSITD